MVESKYNTTKKVAITYNTNETFQKVNQKYFFICHIQSGFAYILINGEKCNISTNMLLCFPKNTSFEVLAAYRLKAKSISFSPEFINKHLNWAVIESSVYSLFCQKINLPCFDIFYKRNMLYNGILPLSVTLSNIVSNLFDEIILQLETQPDIKWSCRSRMKIFSLFEIVDPFWQDIMRGEQHSERFEEQLLNYINLYFCEPIKINRLCNLFHTNRTSLSNKFKSYTGFSIIEYVTKKRLHLACSALATTQLSVKEISKKCGYDDLAYFTKLFTKQIGTTPSKYRTQQRNIRNKYLSDPSIKPSYSAAGGQGGL